MSLEENKPFIRWPEAALNSGRVDAGLELFADPCLFNGQPISREVIRQLRTIPWAVAPDVRWILEHLVAKGARWQCARRCAATTLGSSSTPPGVRPR